MTIDQQKDLIASLLSGAAREVQTAIPAAGPVTITNCTISTINVLCKERPEPAKEP